MSEKKPDGSPGLLILAGALLVCCLAPVLFLSVSFGSLSFLSGFGAYLSVGIAAIVGLASLYFFSQRKRGS